MNVLKLYELFISDRRQKEAFLVEYETHHILPRSLGGTNKKSNLIRLSLSDHVFAHFVLAKLHGGKMYLALIMMLDCGRYEGKISREQYAWAKRKSREYLSELYTGIKRGPHRPETIIKMRETAKRREGPAVDMTDEVRKKIGCASSSRLEDPRYYNALREGSRKRLADPTKKAQFSETMKRVSTTPEGRAAKVRASQIRWERERARKASNEIK